MECVEIKIVEYDVEEGKIVIEKIFFLVWIISSEKILK